MKKLVNNLINPQTFSIYYLSWLAINMIVVVNPLRFTRFVLVFFAIWSVGVAVKIYIINKTFIGSYKYMNILLLFLSSCLLSFLINFSYGGFGSIGRLCYFSLSILILYPQFDIDSMKYTDLLRRAAHSLGIVISIPIAVSLWMFVTMYSKVGVNRAGTVYIGLSENRLFGVFTSPNVGGSYAIILIWCAMIILHLDKKKKYSYWWMGIALFEIILGMTYISLALSKGTYLSGSIAIVTYLLFRSSSTYEQKMKKSMQILLRLASTIVVLGLCIISLKGLHTVSCTAMEFVFDRQHKVEEIIPTDPSSTPPTPSTPIEPSPDQPPSTNNTVKDAYETINNAKKGNEGRTEANRSDIGITNKRYSIWINHLKLLKGRNLIFGINNPMRYYDVTLKNGEEFSHEQTIYINYASGNMHNGFFQILVYCGLISFSIFFLFLLLCLRSVISYKKTCMSPANNINSAYSNQIFDLCFPLVMAILFNNLVETNFALMGTNFIQALFWFTAGGCMTAVTRK